MAYSSETIEKAERLFVDFGFSCREISLDLNVHNSTVWRWYQQHQWQDKKEKQVPTRELLLVQINQLVKGPVTETAAKKIAHLSKALAVLDNLEKKNRRKEVKKPAVRAEVTGDLNSRFRDYEEKNLRKYQRDFVQDDSRFRCMLKARQVGLSWTEAFDMVKNGMLRKVDQNLISTSLGQAENTVRYCRQHLKAMGIEETGKGQKQEIVLPVGDVRIRTLPANQATSQGWPGDVVFDEMAWYRRSKEVWTAVVPSVTAVNGRITCLSTPYEAGPHNHFWSIATNDEDQFGLFSRHSIDIYSAIDQGLSINIEELRQLFDTDTFDRLYLLKFFSDEDSYFSLDELNECRGVCMGLWVGNDRRAGWDMAKKIDASEVVAVEKLAEQIFMRGSETWRRIKYNRQKTKLLHILNKWRIGHLHVDETGVGTGVKDFVKPHIPKHVRQHWHMFTQPFKAIIAQNLKKLVEDIRLVIPHDDRVLISQFLNIKRMATATGISYDIARNSTGHGDRFWALALACSGIEFGKSSGGILTAMPRKSKSITRGFR
ncbi:MAG: hypothetical protein GY749_08090 [Desulfobacteraceae bacterium]|nr:hypothetical protein [Desulfobacteraceae bacterium]